jgi:hypothetical protein
MASVCVRMRFSELRIRCHLMRYGQVNLVRESATAIERPSDAHLCSGLWDT